MRPPALALIALACLTASCGGRAGFNDGSDAGVWDGTDSGSGSDSGTLPDGGHLDAGASDAGLDGGSTGADAGATDAGQITSCAGVCFAWKPPVVVAPVDPTPVYEYTYDHCDQLGLQPDVCPSNFSCGGLQDRRLVSFTYHLHPCVAPSSGSQHVDLSLPAPPPGGLPVDLTLSLNGGTWPSPSAADAGVGQLYFSNVDGGGGLVMADLPRGAPGTVHVSLPAGTYGVTSAMYSADPLAYPPNADQGTLVVADAGTAPVPYTSVNAHVSFALDGTKIGALGASESLIATFTGQHGSTVRLYYFSGQTPDAHVNFEPDTYTLVVQTASYETGVKHVLSGKLQVTTSFVPSAGMSAQFNLPTVAISGTVKANGADLPAAGSGSGKVILTDASNASTSFVLSDSRPASFSGRVYQNTYDVSVDTSSTFMAGIPNGAAQVMKGYVAGPALNLALTSVSAHLTVTLNGGAPPDANGTRGELYLATPTGSSFTPAFPSTGPAKVDVLLWAGTYDVRLGSLTTAMPFVYWPLAPGWHATSTPQTWNVNAHTETVTLTVNGAQPGNGPSGGFETRGSLTFFTRDVPAGQTFRAYGSWALPNTGALSASFLLPDSTWEFTYQKSGNDWTGLPPGGRVLGEVALASNTSSTWDLRTLQVTGNVLVGAQALPLPHSGKTRGYISLNGEYGSSTSSLPLTGTASYSVAAYPGFTDLAFVCERSDGCDVDTLGPTRYVWWGLLLR